MAKSDVQALLFDVFGTVVDWRGSLIADLTAFGAGKGVTANWEAIVDEWRALYQPGMEAVRSGKRPWTILDVLHRESLDALLPKFGLGALDEPARQDLNRAWHRLDPWPDVVPGLTRLKRRFIISPLSNGNVALLANMAKRADIPWDLILGAETSGAYKPLPRAYLIAAAMLGLEPGEVMLAAAHNDDLRAARAVGLRTGFVPRVLEHGAGQKKDLAPSEAWDVVAQDFGDLASQLAT